MCGRLDAHPHYVLRDLAGMAELLVAYDAMAADKNNEWSGSRVNFEEQIDRASRQWFGITAADTEFNEKRDLRQGQSREDARRQWEAQFKLPAIFGPEGDALRIRVWSDLGWDVTDGDGELLLIEHYFQRQMVAATNGVLGRLPGADRTDSEIVQAAEAWGEMLRREVRLRPGRAERAPTPEHVRGDRPPRR